METVHNSGLKISSAELEAQHHWDDNICCSLPKNRVGFALMLTSLRLIHAAGVRARRTHRTQQLTGTRRGGGQSARTTMLGRTACYPRRSSGPNGSGSTSGRSDGTRHLSAPTASWRVPRSTGRGGRTPCRRQRSARTHPPARPLECLSIAASCLHSRSRQGFSGLACANAGSRALIGRGMRHSALQHKGVLTAA